MTAGSGTLSQSSQIQPNSNDYISLSAISGRSILTRKIKTIEKCEYKTCDNEKY